jgi:hypothetical protein
LCGGCLSRPSVVPQSFAFAMPAITAGTNQAGMFVLEIRRLNVAAPFDRQSFVYRTGPFSYETDPYAQFLAAPNQTLLSAMRGYLAGTGRQITTPDSSLQPNAVLEIDVLELCGDFRPGQSPAAVLRINCVCFDARGERSGQVLLQKEYQQRIPFRIAKAAMLMDAWNKALHQITHELNSDLSQVMRPQS